MYRSFLSWRYLLSRRTNLIGVVGIFVAVAALILILSIMTGFLDQSRATVRGTLSDIIVTPHFQTRTDGTSAPRRAGPLLAAIRSDERVAAASARLVYFGLIGQGQENAGLTDALMTSSQYSDSMGVKLLGVDVLTRERRAAAGLEVILRGLFGVEVDFRIQDEFDTTEFRDALTRESGDGILWVPKVADPSDPFAPPPGYEPRGRHKASVIIGEQLARNHRLFPGSIVTITTAVVDPATGELAPSNRDFVVAGTFRTGENEADAGLVYMERPELADFLGGQRDFAEVLVQLHDFRADGYAVRDSLREELSAAGLIRGEMDARWEVRTWEEFRQTLLGAIENERVLMAIMLSLVLVVAGFTVFAILSMMVTEKRKDIGILCAIGATRRGVMQVFLMIAFWDALVGAGLGAIAGTWGAIKIDDIERWLSKTFGVEIFDRSVYYFDHIPSRVDPLAVTTIVLGAFLCALLFAVVPAWRAARLDPLEALRYE